MVAYLEKTDGNIDFHEIIDFVTRRSIHYALTVSPVVSTTFVEQFWMSAKSKIINNVRYITAKVAGKPVTISEASIRSDLLFYDADGIDSMHNQAIFDAIQLMGLKNVPVPLDHFPINALTSKVFSFMVKKGKHFSGNVTPLFESMLVQPTEDEGEASERQSEPQPTPSPPHPSADQHETQPDPSPRPSPTIPIPDSILEGSGGNHGAKEIKHLKAQIKKLKKKAKPVITHHKAWMKSVSMKQRLAGKKSLKTKWMQKEFVSKQGRKPAKAEPIVHKYLVFDDLDDIMDDAMDYMEFEDAQDDGRTSSVVLEEKESTQKGVSTEVKVSTIKPDEGTAEPKDGTSDESNAPTNVFGDDETIAEFLPLPKIDPKDKGKKVLEEEAESDAESKGVDEAERKFDQLAKDEEIARKARIEADRLLAARLQEEERETRFLAQQRATAIRSKPPTRTQLRNQMMTYLKHVGGKKHADLKNKNFEEIQVLYKMVKRSDKDFIAIGSAEEERQIKEMNEEYKDPKKKRVVNETPSTIDSEIMETKSFVSKLHKVLSPDGDYLVVYRVNGYFRAFNYLMEQYSEITPEGIELFLWGDLKIMMESSTEENDQGDFWNNQQEWEVFRWRLYEACGFCILELKDGTVIHMLVERRYPLSKELLQRMLDLGLEVKEESIVALHLVRFIKQQLNEE
ncbi:hypothetical protein Tco_0599533 [Tanacetum coccineum]